VKLLPYNTRLFVSRELAGDWYFATLDDGSSGYVYSKLVEINPPEPKAYLYEIPKGYGAQAIVQQEYERRYLGKKIIQWGMDERHYVNVLVHANQGRRGIKDLYPNTKTVGGARIWIPSLEFAQSLKGKIPSGSISYELWRQVTIAAYAMGDFYLGGAAFSAGLIHGALESVWDLLTGIIDLVELVWDAVKSLFSGDFLSDLKSLWSVVGSMNVSTLLKAGLKEFRLYCRGSGSRSGDGGVHGGRRSSGLRSPA
jgi:hypothetical protein